MFRSISNVYILIYIENLQLINILVGGFNPSEKYFNLPQIGVKIKHIWNQHLEYMCIDNLWVRFDYQTGRWSNEKLPGRYAHKHRHHHQQQQQQPTTNNNNNNNNNNNHANNVNTWVPRKSQLRQRQMSDIPTWSTTPMATPSDAEANSWFLW